MSATLPLALTALALGARHAFDPDHLAAIDNVTRKLVGEGRRSHAVGLFFSLGHSTVVFALCLALALGAHGLGDSLRDEGSGLHRLVGLVGPLVSGTFLLAVGLGNLLAPIGCGGAGRPRGPLAHLFGRALGAVRSPWQMYPVGLLFGLGFDTATEVALLALAGGAGAAALPAYAILALPLAFALGMCALDTLDGVAMGRAYRWSLTGSRGPVAYNVALTGASVASALGLGALELMGVLGLPVAFP